VIKLIAEGFNSKIDRNGNTYWAYKITSTQTGAVLRGKLGGSMRGALSHGIGAAMRKLGLDWDNVHLTETELPIREFNQLVKGWPYPSNLESQIISLVRGSGGSGKRRHPGFGVKVAAHRRVRAKVTSHKRHWPDVLPDTPKKKRRGGKRRASTAGLIAAAKSLKQAWR
jgi:hypothetical protein